MGYTQRRKARARLGRMCDNCGMSLTTLEMPYLGVVSKQLIFVGSPAQLTVIEASHKASFRYGVSQALGALISQFL